MKYTQEKINKMFSEVGDTHTPESIAQERVQALQDIHAHTGRDVIQYFSGGEALIDDDLNGFINACINLKSNTLDIIVHSDGGYGGAVQKIVSYLRKDFKSVRVIVPMQAMSAATMLACSADEILMTVHSCLGPADPQFPFEERYIPGQVILERVKWYYKKANHREKLDFLAQNQDGIVTIRDAVKESEMLVKKWLEQYMFKNDNKATDKCKAIGNWLSHHDCHKTHGRALPLSELRRQGLKVHELENDQILYELVMKSHYITQYEADKYQMTKIICSQVGGQHIRFENHDIQDELEAMAKNYELRIDDLMASEN